MYKSHSHFPSDDLLVYSIIFYPPEIIPFAFLPTKTTVVLLYPTLLRLANKPSSYTLHALAHDCQIGLFSSLAYTAIPFMFFIAA